MIEGVFERVWRLVSPVAESEGMELVDIEYRREGGGMILRVFLDRAGGGGVGLDDLAGLSRQIGDLVEVHSVVPGAYTLELSSPGIDRRLRVPDQFRRYLGQKVRVRRRSAEGGRKVFSGRLDDVDENGVHLSDADGTYFVPFSEIAQANYQSDLWAKEAR